MNVKALQLSSKDIPLSPSLKVREPKLFFFQQHNTEIFYTAEKQENQFLKFLELKNDAQLKYNQSCAFIMKIRPQRMKSHTMYIVWYKCNYITCVGLTPKELSCSWDWHKVSFKKEV